MELSLYIKDKLVSGKRVAIPIMTHPGIELLGKRVLDAVTNGEIHYHATRFPDSNFFFIYSDSSITFYLFSLFLFL